MDKRKKVLIAILSGSILLGALSFSAAVDENTGATSRLTLEDAKRVIAAAEINATAIGVPMNIAVVDVGGDLVAFERMDTAWLGSIDRAINKAYTAVAFNMTTEALGAASQPGEPLFGIEASNDGKLIIFGGGIPLHRNGELVGAIGVSGSSVPNDITVAEAGEAAF